jgi:hypothetical protein
MAFLMVENISTPGSTCLGSGSSHITWANVRKCG